MMPHNDPFDAEAGPKATAALRKFDSPFARKVYSWACGGKVRFQIGDAGQCLLLEKLDGQGKAHSDKGPSCIFRGGGFLYHKHGELHRTDGPAVDLDDRKEWHLEGRPVSQDFFEKACATRLPGPK